MMNLDNNIQYQINFVRLKKIIYLPCELVRFDGTIRTPCYANIDEMSLIE